MLKMKIRNRAGVILGVIVFGWTVTQTSAAETYRIDTWHSEVQFLWSHAGLTQHTAEFTKFGGQLLLDDRNPENSKLSVEINTKSLLTGNDAFDGELADELYFNVKKFPKITFESTLFRKTGTRTGQVTGDLTVRGVTKPVTLDVELVYRGSHPMSSYFSGYKGEWLGIRARAILLRSAFGMNSLIPVISDRIELRIVAELRAKRKKKKRKSN